MGLDTTHGCWHGPYSAFHRWRCAVARAAGIDLESMVGYSGDKPGMRWEALQPTPLLVLLNHPDAEGEIAHEDCAPLADALEALLPEIPEHEGPRADTWRARTREFIAGLRRAHAAGEAVEFH